MVNKKGWIQIVEAFTMIVIIMGFVLVILSKGQYSFSDNSETVYTNEQSILKEIELNNTLRDNVLNSVVPLEWASFPPTLQAKINQSSTLNCTAKICAITDDCTLSVAQNNNVYAQSVLITANLVKYDPRKLKIFCSEK